MNSNNMDSNSREGHRDRLRAKFLSDSSSLSEVEFLELLLTYALPRKDVSPLAQKLLIKYGTLQSVFTAPNDEFTQIDGIGKSAATFLGVIKTILRIIEAGQTDIMKSSDINQQLTLFSANSGEQISTGKNPQTQNEKGKSMRVFANDEIQNALTFIPKAANFNHLDGFQNHLAANLPYNSQATRERRARIIIERLFPGEQLKTPLAYYASQCSSTADLQPVIFYQTLKAEPIAVRVAEELVWPALPIGRIDREQLRKFTIGFLPKLSLSSQMNMLRSIFYTYQLCSVGLVVRDSLRFNLRAGTFESFLYILTNEYPQPGIYTFESLFDGPLHRWLLWDREWIRRQLYNLRDLNVVSKIAEIDSIKQFTLDLDQETALGQFFTDPANKDRVIRERHNEVLNQLPIDTD